MASDSLRAAIINEVEESFNQAQDKNKLSLRLVRLLALSITSLFTLVHEQEALSSWVTGDEDDFLVSPAALEQCKRFGLDCRYSFLKVRIDASTVHELLALL